MLSAVENSLGNVAAGVARELRSKYHEFGYLLGLHSIVGFGIIGLRAVPYALDH